MVWYFYLHQQRFNLVCAILNLRWCKALYKDIHRLVGKE